MSYPARTLQQAPSATNLGAGRDPTSVCLASGKLTPVHRNIEGRCNYTHTCINPGFESGQQSLPRRIRPAAAGQVYSFVVHARQLHDIPQACRRAPQFPRTRLWTFETAMSSQQQASILTCVWGGMFGQVIDPTPPWLLPEARPLVCLRRLKSSAGSVPASYQVSRGADD